jgi:hypothetical protein
MLKIKKYILIYIFFKKKIKKTKVQACFVIFQSNHYHGQLGNFFVDPTNSCLLLKQMI